MDIAVLPASAGIPDSLESAGFPVIPGAVASRESVGILDTAHIPDSPVPADILASPESADTLASLEPAATQGSPV